MNTGVGQIRQAGQFWSRYCLRPQDGYIWNKRNNLIHYLHKHDLINKLPKYTWEESKSNRDK